MFLQLYYYLGIFSELRPFSGSGLGSKSSLLLAMNTALTRSNQDNELKAIMGSTVDFRSVRGT